MGLSTVEMSTTLKHTLTEIRDVEDTLLYELNRHAALLPVTPLSSLCLLMHVCSYVTYSTSREGVFTRGEELRSVKTLSEDYLFTVCLFIGVSSDDLSDPKHV